MGKKKAPEGAPLWMVTYSDMVTLLMTFFVMLLAMANFDESSKVDAVMGSIRVALGAGQQGAGVGPGEQSHERESRGEVGLDSTKAMLQETLASQASPHFIQMSQTESEIRVQLSDRIMFEPGKATLHPSAYVILEEIAGALKGKKVFIEVHGHTDGTGKIADNWQVSSDRALAVLLELQARGRLDGKFMRAVGLGQYHPADLEGGSSDWNRRVELVIRARSGDAYEAVNGIEGPQ
ncbi:MAG: chemotaxis protein MotB [Myxococcota bacterium]|jgi:chemotaxis protein MotB